MPHVCYMSANGVTQGAITAGAFTADSVGEVYQEGHEDECLIQAVSHTLLIPRDPQSGQPTGQRVHQPLKITKTLDKSSPLFCNALCSGERLDKVELKWYRVSSTGGSEHYYTTTLTDAIVINIETYMPNALDPANAPYKHMEEISFSYNEINWEHTLASTAGNDSWKKPREHD